MQQAACWQVAAPVYVFHPICLTFLWCNEAACSRPEPWDSAAPRISSHLHDIARCLAWAGRT